MRRLVRLGPCAAAATLAAVILVELAGGGPPPPAVAPPARPAVARAAGWRPTAAAEARRAATILARPLFDPSRRPPAGPAAAGSLRLSGVVVGPFGRLAIFEPAQGGKPVVVRVGERVGGAIVRAIAPDRVLVAGIDGPRVLLPSDGAAAAGVAVSGAVASGEATAPARPAAHPSSMATRLLEAK